MSRTLHPMCQAMCVVMCLTSCGATSDVDFTSTPPTIRQLVTDHLTLRCSLKDKTASTTSGKPLLISDASNDTSPSNMNFVHSIIIHKHGRDLASVSEHVPAKVFDTTTDVQVAGKVPGTMHEKAYLLVSWSNPGSEQTGSYQCVISSMDQNGHVQTFIKTLDIAESEASLSDVVGYIQQLKHTNDQQATTIGRLKSNITGLKANESVLKEEINNLKSSSNEKIQTLNRDLRKEVNNLNIRNSKLKDMISELNIKLGSHVLFTATLSADVTVSPGQVVVFNNLVTDIGGGYSPHTGVFSCPVSGDYVFHLHVRGQRDKFAVVCLAHNTGRCVTAATAEQDLDFQTASTSVSLRLRQGDAVKAVGHWTTSYVEGNASGDSSFSGYLVAATKMP